MSQRFFAGQTKPGATAWQQYPSGTGIFVDVDTSAGKFSTTPVYVTSLAGISHHWATTGSGSVYKPTSTGFRIYIRWADGKPMTPDDIAGFAWHINWIGIETIADAT
jgi:hypothetical protein